jgi:hypothetical protein
LLAQPQATLHGVAMSRVVAPKRARKAKRVLCTLAQAAPDTLSAWEKSFVEEVDARRDTYGSAFRDFSKGAPDEALSRLQTVKLKEIAAKAKGKVKKPLRARKPKAANPKWGSA